MNGCGGRWRIRLCDVVLALGAAVYQVRDLLLRSAGDWRLDGARWGDVAVWIALSVLLLLRRRWPLVVAVLAVAADLVSFYPAAEAVAMFTVGTSVRSRRVQGAVLAASGVSHALVYWYGHGSTMAQLFPHYIVFSVTPLLLGLFIAGRQERLEYMERERVLLDERATAQERRRIGREMHDVVAHGVSHMVFRAGALQMAAENRRAEWAVEEALTLQALGRGVLGELRTALGLLKDTGRGERMPLPTVEDLPALLAHARESGLAVRLHQEGGLASLEPQYGRTVYRVVQEALTNVVKHAPGAATTVDIIRAEHRLTVRVVNLPPGPRADSPTTLPAGGHGLLGMRERVTLLRGTLQAAPTPDGGFRIEALIPLPPLTGLRQPPSTETEP